MYDRPSFLWDVRHWMDLVWPCRMNKHMFLDIHRTTNIKTDNVEYIGTDLLHPWESDLDGAYGPVRVVLVQIVDVSWQGDAEEVVFLPQAAQLQVCHVTAQVEGGDGCTCTNIPEFHGLIPWGRDQLGAVRAPADLEDLKAQRGRGETWEISNLRTGGGTKSLVLKCIQHMQHRQHDNTEYSYLQHRFLLCGLSLHPVRKHAHHSLHHRRESVDIILIKKTRDSLGTS